MLKTKAEIRFTLEGKNYSGELKLRPVFNFGKELLFSGAIESDDKMYFYNKPYTVDIIFFTVEDEAYAAVQPLLQNGMNLAIQEGSNKIIGIAKLINFEYVV